MNMAGSMQPELRLFGSKGRLGIVIATKAHRDELNRRLQALGLDTARSAKQGRFVMLDADETLSKFMVDGWPDEAMFSEVIGSVIQRVTSAVKGAQPRVAAFGEKRRAH